MNSCVTLPKFIYKFQPITLKPHNSQSTSHWGISTNMAKASSSLSLIVPVLFVASIATFSTATPSSFIKSSCSTTQYPSVCVESLSVYASSIQQDPQQLVQTALSLSLNTTLSTKAFVSKLNKFRGLKGRENEALRDCLEEIGDGVDRLGRSIKELKLCRGKGQDFAWHISNVETWVSSAITDESSCSDGFAGRALNGRIKSSIRVRMVRVAQVTSNALALINQYASKHWDLKKFLGKCGVCAYDCLDLICACGIAFRLIEFRSLYVCVTYAKNFSVSEMLRRRPEILLRGCKFGPFLFFVFWMYTTVSALIICVIWLRTKLLILVQR